MIVSCLQTCLGSRLDPMTPPMLVRQTIEQGSSGHRVHG